MTTLTLPDYLAEGEKLFGKDKKQWQYKCPKCGTAQSYNDFEEHKIENAENYVGFSCIGRFVENKGCDWTLGGFFQFHNLEVIDENGKAHPRFEFNTQTP
jgi:hypothetical protein